MGVSQHISTVEENILTRLNAAGAIALRMLPKMVVQEGPQAGLFCQKVKLDKKGALIQEGASVRYTMMALIGIGAAFGPEVFESRPWKPAADQLYRLLADDRLDLPELGLLLWLDQYRGGGAASRILVELDRRWGNERKYAGSMETAWVLTALARTPDSAESNLAGKVLKFLLASFNPVTGLFVLNGNRSAIPWGSNRMNRSLGSFAAQVYPIIALAHCLESRADTRLAEILRKAAGKTCRLQGPEGQWWWIFNARTGAVFLDYPVYSVHQDAMGPMALLAASRALGTREYLPAVSRGLDHMFRYQEPRTLQGFIDPHHDVIWRAAIKDIPREDPADTPFGLGEADLRWMRSAGQLASGAPSRATAYRMLKEARPYCPGWILLAYSQACQLFGRPVALEPPAFELSDRDVASKASRSH